MGASNEAKLIEAPLHRLLGFLDALGYFDFLLPGQQRHLAHLFQVHPHRIVEDIELRLRLFLFLLFDLFFPVLIAVDF